MALDHHPSDMQTSHTGTGGATTIAVTLPLNYVTGDLLNIAIGQSLDQGFTTPSGWILVGGVADGFGGNRIAYFRKIASGSEGSSVTITATSSATMAAVAWRTTGFDSTTPINVSGTNSGTSASTTAMTAPSVSTTVVNCDIVRIAACRQATSITQPASNTNIGFDQSGTAFDQSSISVCFRSQAATGASGTAAFVEVGGSHEWVTLTAAIAPAISTAVSDSSRQGLSIPHAILAM